MFEHSLNRAIQRACAQSELTAGALRDLLDDGVAVAIGVGKSEQDVKGGCLQREECLGFAVEIAHAGSIYPQWLYVQRLEAPVPNAATIRARPPVIHVTDLIAIDDREIEERFVRSSGPGGQNVNKVASAVELRFNVLSSSLPQDVKDRLIAIAGHRVTDEGVLVIDSREHRTQAMNREAARARLVALLQQAARRPKRRKRTTPSAAARERRLESKKRRSAIKATRTRRDDD